MKTLQECLYHKLLLPSAFKIYAFLFLNAEHKSIEIGIEGIVRELRMSHQTVASGINNLCKYGFIKVERHQKNKEGKTLPNRYVLL